ncbi:patatin-like phospholipase family protein [Leptospira stimsonii]|uniref:Patatin-like phospholipase family protein n=1 Tax=Leptospira stimsonii TaxID=2202203 RepID=A0ABY2N1H6_9LEPT|nr:patatin-like phospholipase family protein [Leptospira stimsonii]TGK20530.1 patatin-like phospholipase family protein [Leptospira stimsonii]TGM14320.1 patatin-like phospholipase family protein [Leptospira stimsonii]
MKRALILSGGGARGAYQAGVLRYLEEIQFKPDIICGTSVGAITATAMGCGMNAAEITKLWKSIEAKKVMRYSIWNDLVDIFVKSYSPLTDTTPLKNLLYSHLDFRNLRKNPTEVIITAVNILTAELVFFRNKEIDIEHVMASSAIPMFFPWQYVDGAPHWDGGVMANTPILPAVERGATDIVVVLLSPVGGIDMGLPKTRREGLERVFELSLIGSFQTVMSNMNFEKKKRKGKKSKLSSLLSIPSADRPELKIRTIGPRTSLGFSSILNFSQVQADYLISRGYEDARIQFNE